MHGIPCVRLHVSMQKVERPTTRSGQWPSTPFQASDTLQFLVKPPLLYIWHPLQLLYISFLFLSYSLLVTSKMVPLPLSNSLLVVFLWCSIVIFAGAEEISVGNTNSSTSGSLCKEPCDHSKPAPPPPYAISVAPPPPSAVSQVNCPPTIEIQCCPPPYPYTNVPYYSDYNNYNNAPRLLSLSWPLLYSLCLWFLVCFFLGVPF